MPSQYSNKTSASAHFKHQATPSKHSKKAKKTKKTKKTKKEPKHKKAKKEKKSTGESALPKKKAEAQPTTSPHEKTRMGHRLSYFRQILQFLLRRAWVAITIGRLSMSHLPRLFLFRRSV